MGAAHLETLQQLLPCVPSEIERMRVSEGTRWEQEGKTYRRLDLEDDEDEAEEVEDVARCMSAAAHADGGRWWW